MKNVFIDTSSFRNKSFDFEGRLLKALIDLCRAGRVRLIVTSVTRRECVRRIKELCKDLEAKASKLNIVLRNTGRAELQNSSFEQDMLARWERFLLEAKAVEVPIANADIESVFDLYFDNKPPFGTGKKQEFPDAVVASALDEWCHENGESVYVVTGDHKLLDVETRHLLPLPSIEEFLSDVNKEIEAENYRKAERAFEVLKNEIAEAVRTKMDTKYYHTPNEWFSEVADFTAETVHVISPYYISLEDGRCSVDVDVDVDFSASLSFAEDDMIYRDSDTRDFVAVDKVHSSVSSTFSTTIAVDIEYGDDPTHPSITKVEVPIDIEFEIELDEPYRKDVEIVGTSRI